MTKTMLAISLTAVLAMAVFAFPLGIADAMNSFLDVKKASVEIEDDEFDEIEFEAKADIPIDASGGSFGFGIIYANPIIPNDAAAVLDVTATHGGMENGFKDSEAQSDRTDPVFHNHKVALQDSQADGSGLCDGLEVRDITYQQPGEVEVEDEEVEMEEVPFAFSGTHSLSGANIDFLADENVGLAVSFTIDPVDATGTTNPFDIQAVCINDVAPAQKLKVETDD